MIDRNRKANIQLSELVREQMTQFFGVLDLSNPYQVRDDLLEVVPAIAETYAPIGVQMGLEWYEEMAIASGAAASFRSLMPPPLNLTEAMTKAVRYAAGHLFLETPDPQRTLKVLNTKMDKFVKEPGRQTVIYNAENGDGAIWVRVPTGDETCSFCMVLATRGVAGPAYNSERSAGSKIYGEENLFHGDCDCEVIRLGKFDEYPPGYVPEDLYDLYKESTKRVGSNDLKAVLHDFRRRFPDLVKDGVDDPEYLERMP